MADVVLAGQFLATLLLSLNMYDVYGEETGAGST